MFGSFPPSPTRAWEPTLLWNHYTQSPSTIKPRGISSRCLASPVHTECLCPQPGVVPLGIGTLKGMRAKMSSANPEHPSAERLHLRAGSLLFSELADSCEGRQLVQRGQGRSTDHLHAHIALAEVWRPKVFSSAGASMRRAARKSA